MTTEAIQRSMEAWRNDPGAARTTTTVRAWSEGPVAVMQAGSFVWRAGLPAALGGADEAPSPTSLLLGALAGCAVALIRSTLGPQLGVRIDAVDARARCAVDARGLVGLAGADPPLGDLRLDVRITTPDGEAGVAEVARAWRERCPTYLALVAPTPVALRFEAVDPHIGS